jgi:hypothetical protein
MASLLCVGMVAVRVQRTRLALIVAALFVAYCVLAPQIEAYLAPPPPPPPSFFARFLQPFE